MVNTMRMVINLCTACFNRNSALVCCDVHERPLCGPCYVDFCRGIYIDPRVACNIDWEQQDTHIPDTVIEGLKDLIEELK